jgi:hypothetical protein
LYASVVQGFVTPTLALVALGIIAVIAFATVALVLARRDQERPWFEPLVWPILIWTAVFPYSAAMFAYLLELFTDADSQSAMRWLFPDRLPGACLTFILLAIICHRYAARQSNHSLYGPEVLFFSSLVCVSVGAPTWLNVSLLTPGPFVILIAIMTLIAEHFLKSLKPSGDNQPPSPTPSQALD